MCACPDDTCDFIVTGRMFLEKPINRKTNRSTFLFIYLPPPFFSGSSVIAFRRFPARAQRCNATLTPSSLPSSDLHAPSSERGCGRNCLCGRVGDYMGVEMYEGPAACTYQNPLDLKRGLLSHNLQNKAQGEW